MGTVEVVMIEKDQTKIGIFNFDQVIVTCIMVMVIAIKVGYEILCKRKRNKFIRKTV